jgi:arsenical pump membrane protein
VSSITFTQGATWVIAALATGGVIVRPWALPEALWAVLGAVALIALSLVPWREALHAVGNGTDVYLFLTGMMLLAELARQRGVFNWLAARAVRLARGSASRLFALVFAVATLVTALLSNDATAVVLTPAVFAAAKAAQAKPLPYLFICAFVANAASFVLPISNPANLVVYGRYIPTLPSWLAQFALPSALAILATFVVLRLAQRASLREAIAVDIPLPVLTRSGRWTVLGIALSAAVLLTASTFDFKLGLPTFLVAIVTAGAVLFESREPPWPLLKPISWSVLPLVAGLFVLVEGLIRTDVIQHLSTLLTTAAGSSTAQTSWEAGMITAVACNFINNLPAGLIARSVLAAGASVPASVAHSLLIGVDLGPNFSITGSLATILWLIALRREGEDISAWRFLRLGVLVTVPALVLALSASHWGASHAA